VAKTKRTVHFTDRKHYNTCWIDCEMRATSLIAYQKALISQFIVVGNEY